jgi:hypothetical protein
MHRPILAYLAVLVFAPLLWGLDEKQDKEKPKTPREQFEAISQEYRKTLQDYQKAVGEAKSNEERMKVLREKYPQPAKYTQKMLQLAEKNPKDPVAVDAGVWALQHARGGPDADKAYTVLSNHADSKNLGTAVQYAAFFTRSPAAEKFLRSIMEKNPDRTLKGNACFSLAEIYREKSEQADPKKTQQLEKQAEALYERVVKEFAEIKGQRGSLGAAAKSALNEIRLLGIGKVAPDIKGEDTDGKAFKLSDYRGKVVLLDFWGNW